MSSKTYTCAHCGGTFESGWSDEDAIAEARAAFGDQLGKDLVQVCDDCYRVMTAEIPPKEWVAEQRRRPRPPWTSNN